MSEPKTTGQTADEMLERYNRIARSQTAPDALARAAIKEALETAYNMVLSASRQMVPTSLAVKSLMNDTQIDAILERAKEQKQ